ncbi:MAG: hypothetical protein AAGC76_03775 [Luteibacter sp.]|uniref:hypothetical protein n=1 Tax=unclassified Luteibacter TaxID=2620188 RepID=UPI0005BE54D8|nr:MULTISPECIES: hypothetical protein [unclassified Luteibacter]MDQ7994953.1 hypothetical protein [Luteibacter sp.]MDQ8047532.1 hypothetical protein [Luteibacter sp.]SKB74536.1 hypothetical protein SAMN05660880_02413 [Luteibacter sp. 22Crub2.1]
MKHPAFIAGLSLALLLCAVPFPAVADEPCCDNAHGYHHSGPLYLGVPVAFDGGEKTPGRYGVLVPMDGSDALFAACSSHGGVWVAGETNPVACNRVTKGDTLAVLGVDPAALGGAGQGLALPVVFSTTAFKLFEPSIAKAVPVDVASVRALDPSLDSAAIETISLPDGSSLLFMAGTRHVPDGNGENDCATTAETVFTREHGILRRAAELPARPTGLVLADKPYLIVPVDCGKRVGIWAVGKKVEQVGYFDNGYEYGG